MSARIDFAVFLAVIAATLAVAVAVGRSSPARADELIVLDDGPYRHGRHDLPPPYYYRPYPYHRPHERVVVIAPPPPVVVEPAPAVVAPPPIQTAAAPAPYCREYQTVTVVDGKPVPSYGQACRQPDGSWKIVSRNP